MRSVIQAASGNETKQACFLRSSSGVSASVYLPSLPRLEPCHMWRVARRGVNEAGAGSRFVLPQNRGPVSWPEFVYVLAWPGGISHQQCENVMVKKKKEEEKRGRAAVHIWIQLRVFTLTTSCENYGASGMRSTLLSRLISLISSQLTSRLWERGKKHEFGQSRSCADVIYFFRRFARPLLCNICMENIRGMEGRKQRITRKRVIHEGNPEQNGPVCLHRLFYHQI